MGSASMFDKEQSHPATKEPNALHGRLEEVSLAHGATRWVVG